MKKIYLFTSRAAGQAAHFAGSDGSIKKLLLLVQRSMYFTMVLALLLLSGVGAKAASRYSVATGNWSATTTWSATSGGASGASVPVSGDDVYIEGGFTVTLDVPADIGNGTLSVAAGSTLDLSTYTLGSPSGTTLYCGAATGSSISGSGTLTLGGNVSVIDSDNGSAGATISCPVGLGDVARTFTVTDDGTSATDLSISGVISGGGEFIKSGAGTMQLSGSNTYTGITSVNEGTLKPGATGGATAGPLGNPGVGTVISPGATLDLNGITLIPEEPLTLNGTGISNGGALMNSGAATTFSGLITLASASSIVGGTGSINIVNSETITGSGFGLTLGGDQGGTLSSILGTGSGTLTKEGTGTWTISGANTYTGLTIISEGTLKLGAAGGAANTPLGTAAAGTSVTSGAVFDLNGYTLGTDEALTLNGTGISGGGALVNSSATAVIYNGVITLGSASSIGTTGNITLSSGITGGEDLTKVGGGTLGLGSGTATLGGLTISAGTLIATSGTMNLAGDFTNNSAFTANNGTVNFNGTAQTIAGSSSTFNNLTISSGNSTTLSINTTISGSLSITGSAKASLTDGTTSSTGTLILEGLGAPNGSWGSTSSSATYRNDTYFLSPNTGILNVTTSSCTAPSALVLTGSTICTSPGDNGTITSTTSESGVNYQLYNASNATVQAPQAGTGSGLTWSDLTPGIGYYVIGTNVITACVSPGSNAVDISTMESPIALALTGSTICSFPGDDGTITSTTSESGVNYQLYNSGNATVQTPQAGTGSGLSWSNLPAGTGYYVIGTNAVICTSISNIVNVATINSPIALVLTGSTICASLGDNGTITSTTSESGVNYQLYDASNAIIQTAQEGTGSGLTWSGLAPGTGYYVIGTNATTSCVSPASNAVDISATDNPTALVLTGSTICTSPGDNGTITSTTSESGVNYQLYDASNATVQAAQEGTGSGLTWSGLAPGTGYYVIGTNATTSCVSPGSNAVDISTIDSPIALVLTGSTICSFPGDDGTITSTASESGVNYQLYDSGNATVQTPQEGTGSGLTWSDITPGTGYYVIGTNATTSCASPGSNAVDVSTMNSPIALVLTGSTICASLGDNGTITSTTSESGVNYQLYDSGNTAVQTAQEGTGSGLTWADLAPGTGYYVIGTNATTSCVSPGSNAVDISATDNPIALVLTGSTICTSPGDNGTITSTTSENGVNYQLYDSGNATVQAAQEGTGSGLTWSGLAPGTGYYVIGTNATTSCVSPASNVVDVSTTENPSAPASGGNQIICANQTIPALTVTVGVGETADWYDASSGGILLQSDQLTYTPTEAGTYYAEARNLTTGCVSIIRTGVTLEINPQGVLTGSTICSGGTGQLIFTASSGTGPFTLVIDGQTYTGIVSGTPFNADPNPTETTNYTLTSVTDANNCVRTFGFAGESATITVIGSGSWLGETSADWNDGSNWCGGVVPAAGNDITITSLAANQPVISNTPTAVCNNLTINSGASLTINAGQALTVNGILTNNGTLNLNSDATGTASLIHDIYAGTGTNNIQLYLTGGGDATSYPWHYISSPVASLSTTDVMTSGADPDANDLAAYYENLVTTSKQLAWFGYDGWNYQSDDGLPAGSTFGVLEVGRGYNYYSYYNATRTFGGTFNTAQVTKAITYHGSTPNLDAYGWNLVGNPFSSSIDWDGVGRAFVLNAIYFTKNNGFASYVNGVGAPDESVTGIIPPMQGFFVKTNRVAGGTIYFYPESRVHGDVARYKGKGELIPLVRLKIEGSKMSDGTVLRFDEKATATFDSEFDAYKFSTTGTAVSLWTFMGSVNYSINSIAFPDTVTEIPVGMNAIESGTFKLTATQLQGLENYDVFLVDKTTGTATNLKKTATINIAASEGTVTDRFVIKIINISTGVENPLIPESAFNIYASKDFVNIQTLSDKWDGKSGSVDLIDMTGKTVRKINNSEFWKNSLIQIPSAGYKGMYFVKLQSGLMKYVGKVMIK
jgi:autotransporter-associated beta strand protein